MPSPVKFSSWPLLSRSCARISPTERRQQGVPPGVSHARRHLRGSDDIQEEDRGQATGRRGSSHGPIVSTTAQRRNTAPVL